MNKSRHSYLKPLSGTSVWGRAFSSHLELNTMPPLFSQVGETKGKEKGMTCEEDGAVSRASPNVLKHSSGGDVKTAPVLAADTLPLPLPLIFSHFLPEQKKFHLK